MARRRLDVLGALVLAAMLTGCAGEERAPSHERPHPIPASTDLDCPVGERPGYFVPGPAGGPLALLGCARLGVSGKRVEFSGNVARIDGSRHACVNPAYSGRGQRGFFIPALCVLRPALSRFAVRDAAQPRQGVRGYAYVIWGTAGASTEVVATVRGGRTARAAVFRVGADLARTFGAPPFGLFAVELRLSAACAPVTVAGDAPGAVDRVRAQPTLCEAARRRAGRA